MIHEVSPLSSEAEDQMSFKTPTDDWFDVLHKSLQM